MQWAGYEINLHTGVIIPLYGILLAIYLLLQEYSYRVKIINPRKKSDFQTRELHHFHAKFPSVIELKGTLMEEFTTQLPETTDFSVGYFSGKQSAKRWVINQDDLDLMYKTGKTSILLWCDARVEPPDADESAGRGCKRKSPTEPCATVSKRKQIELQVDEIVSELKEKQGAKYTVPQLRLWARMINSGNHESTDDPPNLPAITGIDPKKPKKPSLSDAIVMAATSFANAVRGPDITQTGSCNAAVVVSGDTAHTPTKSTITNPQRLSSRSPGRVTELRIKKLQELKELQQLLEQKILTQEEFAEQKALVLRSLRKLTD